MSGDVEVVLVVGRGTPRPRRRVVTFKVDVEVVERLDELARRLGRSRSDLIREALEHYLALNGASVEEPPRAVRPGELLGGW